MKQHPFSAFADAVPVDGRGRRTPATLLRLDERDSLLREAAQFYLGASDREIARRLRSSLSLYRGGRWRRDRSEALCPPRYAGKVAAALWRLLKVHDAIPSEMTIRRALAGIRDPHNKE